MSHSVQKQGLWAWVFRMVRQPLFANAGFLFGIEILNSVVGFAFWGLAARFYAPASIGLATGILSAAALVSGIANLGMSIGVIRFLPLSDAPTRLINTVLTLSLGLGLIVGIGYLVGLSWWSPALLVLHHNSLYSGGFIVYALLATTGTLVRTAFVAHRRAGYALAYTGILNLGRLALVLPLVSLNAAGMVGATGGAMALAVIASLCFFLGRVSPGYRPRLDFKWADVRMIVPYSAGNYTAGLLAQTTQIILPLMVLEILGQTASGYAYMPLMVGSLLISPGAALAGSAFAEDSHAPQDLLPILFRAVSVGMAVTIPAALVTWIAAAWVLLLLAPITRKPGRGCCAGWLSRRHWPLFNWFTLPTCAFTNSKRSGGS